MEGGLLRGWWWPVGQKLVFDRMAAPVPEIMDDGYTTGHKDMHGVTIISRHINMGTHWHKNVGTYQTKRHTDTETWRCTQAKRHKNQNGQSQIQRATRSHRDTYTETQIHAKAHREKCTAAVIHTIKDTHTGLQRDIEEQTDIETKIHTNYNQTDIKMHTEIHTDREAEEKRQHLRMQVGIHSRTKGHCCKLHTKKYVQTHRQRWTAKQ
jgi:hypothetical protein